MTTVFLYWRMKMSNKEQLAIELKKLHCLRGGNRGVVTKHENDINDIITSCADPQKSTDKLIRLNSIATTLKEKRRCLKALAEVILGKTELELIEKEIDETSDWETRIYECFEKIEAFKQGYFVAIRLLYQVENQSQGHQPY